MKSFHENMQEYKKQLEKGAIKQAYKGLMEYFNSLRLYFEKKYPDYFVSGSIYQGYMDMTFFSFTPKSLKSQKLKVAIVYLHEAFRFEVWLVGYNKKIQTKYWKLIKARAQAIGRNIIFPLQSKVLTQLCARELEFR